MTANDRRRTMEEGRKKGDDGRGERREGGFTLLEVIVVFALMALVSGLAALYFAGSMTSSRLDKCAREMAGTVRYGRVLAAETGEIQSITIDLDSRSYRIEGRRAVTIPGDIALSITDQRGIEARHGTYYVHLLPSGTVQTGTLTLQKGRSLVSLRPDPVVGLAVMKQ